MEKESWFEQAWLFSREASARIAPRRMQRGGKGPFARVWKLGAVDDRPSDSSSRRLKR